MHLLQAGANEVKLGIQKPGLKGTNANSIIGVLWFLSHFATFCLSVFDQQILKWDGYVYTSKYLWISFQLVETP